MNRLTIWLIIVGFLLSSSVEAAYVIRGKINLGEDWQPKVYLASINKLTDYYRASAQIVIQIGMVNPQTGYFELKGDNLPSEQRYYRLYTMKEQNSDVDACLYVGGDDHNFVHLVLDNDSQIEITADSTYFSPFGNYQIHGDFVNQQMRSLAHIVYPRFSFYTMRFPTELKLSEEKLYIDLKHFTDTCSNPLVAIAAINNTDMEQNYTSDPLFYEAFGDRIQKELPNSIYTHQYIRKLAFQQFDGIVRAPTWMIVLLTTFGLLTIGLSLLSLWLYRNLKKEQTFDSKLTAKEQEILRLIATGKSNKEIANALFVEVSTVKSHINKIYAKLKVKNRREVMELVKKGGSTTFFNPR